MASPSTPAPDRRSHWLWLVGLAITIASLAWAVQGVRWGEFLSVLRTVQPLYLLGTVILATLTFPLRAARWRVMLRDEQDRPFPWAPLWHSVAIGFMANNILPARAGEVARAYVVKRQLPVRFTTALGTIGVERIFDALLMLGLMALAIAAPSFPKSADVGSVSLARLANGAAVLFGAALVAAFIVALRPAAWVGMIDRIARGVLPTRFAEPAVRAAEGVISGLGVLRRPGRFAALLFWSVVQWLVNAASFALCFRAFGLAVPPEGALLLQGALGFGVAIPSSPGFAGVFEKATQLSLGLYGVAATPALAYALTYHVATFIPITVLGLYSLRRVHLQLRDLRAADVA
ncbi:MAG TPA: lysylphosphatidylglycerol synthase transmembrane domain-containing protein [Gemmatimonadales bacterium]|nr:lysylphosphatidylglycerol synthase transmembrane domain-containing protein [Gemmatimonadales bacterium]